jgi:hypothetical protein
LNVIFHGSKYFRIIFYQLLKSIINSIRNLSQSLLGSAILVNFLVLDAISRWFNWGNLGSLETIFLLTIISLILNASHNFFIYTRTPHLLMGLIFIGGFHDLGDRRLGLKLLMMNSFCVVLRIPLLVADGDWSILVLLFHPGLFSALYPFELILLSLVWFAAETEWPNFYSWVFGSRHCCWSATKDTWPELAARSYYVRGLQCGWASALRYHRYNFWWAYPSSIKKLIVYNVVSVDCKCQKIGFNFREILFVYAFW